MIEINLTVKLSSIIIKKVNIIILIVYNLQQKILTNFVHK